MGLYEEVMDQTNAQWEREMGRNPAFHLVNEGGWQRSMYVAYLRETCHLVRHTSLVLALASAHLNDDHRSLRSWFIEQAGDEHNHDLLCINDLRALGENPERVLRSHPKLGAWSLITQAYYVARYRPLAILGYVLTTESVGANYADHYADLLMTRYGYDANQVTFIRAHGGFDAKHIDDVKQMMELGQGQ